MSSIIITSNMKKRRNKKGKKEKDGTRSSENGKKIQINV